MTLDLPVQVIISIILLTRASAENFPGGEGRATEKKTEN